MAIIKRDTAEINNAILAINSKNILISFIDGV